MTKRYKFDPAKEQRCLACKKADCDFIRGTAAIRAKKPAFARAVMALDNLCSCPCHDVRGVWLLCTVTP